LTAVLQINFQQVSKVKMAIRMVRMPVTITSTSMARCQNVTDIVR